jgi:SAM-dependent methyltransferase
VRFLVPFVPGYRQKADEAVRHLHTRPGRPALPDVGCGEGEFLAEMQALGWAVEGIEPSARGAAAARCRGFPVIESTFVLYSPSSLRRLLSTIGFEAVTT